MYYGLVYATRPSEVWIDQDDLYRVTVGKSTYTVKSNEPVNMDSGILLIRAGTWITNELLPPRMAGNVTSHETQGAVLAGSITTDRVRSEFACVLCDHNYTELTDVTDRINCHPWHWTYNERTVFPVHPATTVLPKIEIIDADVTGTDTKGLYSVPFNRGVIAYISTSSDRKTVVQTNRGDSFNDPANFTWSALRDLSIMFRLPLITETVVVVEVSGSTIGGPVPLDVRRTIHLIAAYDKRTNRMFSFSELETMSRLAGIRICESGEFTLSISSSHKAFMYSKAVE